MLALSQTGRRVVDRSGWLGRPGHGWRSTDQPIGCVGSSNTAAHRKLNRYDLPTKWVQLHWTCHTKMDARPYQSSEPSARPLPSTPTSRLHCLSTMTDKSKQPKRRDGAIRSLDVAIGLVNIGKEASSMTPAPAVFGVVTILLTTIRVSFVPLRSERDVPGSNTVRTRWPMSRIAWTSGYCVPTSVMR